MYFQRIYEKGLAQASYFVGCQATTDAIVIDPGRNIEEYLETAEREKLNIRYVVETHIHADFLSGARELAAATGAEILLSDEGGTDWQYLYEHTALRDGDSFKVGNLRFEVIHTPGHTPEHISFLLYDLPTSDQPVMIFTGDFVFVGDVGRPDLLEEAAGLAGTRETGARQMFHSLGRFRSLPDHLQLWPGHGAGSACGKALGAIPGSTVGYEKISNWALNIEDEVRFIEILLEGQPEAPLYFAMMKKLNREGPKILGTMPYPERLSMDRFTLAMEDGVTVIDTRDKLSFAGGHVPGSINIQDNASFSTWAGWILNYGEPFLLIAADHRVKDLSTALARVGFDSIHGYVSDLEHITGAGQELTVLEQLTVDELAGNSNRYHVIDVRNRSEYDSGHIPDAENIHAGRLSSQIDTIPTDRDLVVQCASGDRSSIAASILKSNGFGRVRNLTGGFNAWSLAGYEVRNGESGKRSKLVTEASPAVRLAVAQPQRR